MAAALWSHELTKWAFQKKWGSPNPFLWPSAKDLDPGFARAFGGLGEVADKALALWERDLAAAKAAATASLGDVIPNVGTQIGHTKTLCENNGITQFKFMICFPHKIISTIEHTPEDGTWWKQCCGFVATFFTKMTETPKFPQNTDWFFGGGEPRWDHAGTTPENSRSTPGNRRSTLEPRCSIFFSLNWHIQGFIQRLYGFPFALELELPPTAIHGKCLPWNLHQLLFDINGSTLHAAPSGRHKLKHAPHVSKTHVELELAFTAHPTPGDSALLSPHSSRSHGSELNLPSSTFWNG